MMKTKLLLITGILILLASAVIAQPDWTLNPGDYNSNMTVTGIINLDFTECTDVNDMMAAFINGECRGITKPIYQATIDRYIVYLMIYSNEVSGNITFKVYDASADATINIPASMEFSVNDIIGSAEEPYVWSNPTLSNKAEINVFTIPEQVGSTIYDGVNITLHMPYGVDISNIIADYSSSDNAVVMVNNIVQTTGVSINNFETAVQYFVRSADETAMQTYTVTVDYANSIPTDINISTSEMEETKNMGTVICSFSTVDANINDTHTYSFVAGIGDIDNECFMIYENELILNTALDFETKSSYSIRIQTLDNNGGLFEKQFNIYVIDKIEVVVKAVNVFSPNNDGINDYWELEDSYTFNSCNFFIFNNTGKIIYESTGYNNNWDGTYKGGQLPVGTYYYLIKCPSCNDCKYTGSISLIR